MSSPSRAKTPASRAITPATASPTLHARKVTAEEISKAVERLSRAHTPNVQLEPLPLKEVPKLPPSKLEESATRLCNHTVEMKKKSMERLNEKFLVDKRPHTVMSTEETQNSVSRLFYTTIQTMEQKRAKLKSKYLAPGAPVVKDNAKVEHAVAHLYTEEKERAAARQATLFERYVKTTEPKMLKVTSEAQIKAIVDRLGAVKS